MKLVIRTRWTRVFAGLLASGFVLSAQARQPNVILIITDDQGYGEIGAHGHPQLKTPHMDRLHGESVRLTDFHVDPTCSPTRSALMTGRYSTRTGVWHTINGRSLMRPEELTLAEVFKANGYGTAMIGKWHLGDSYPCRPDDQGFDHTVWHLDGCIGGGPDYWENDYYDDTYQVNGEWKKFDGYCTDVWFREAVKWIGGQKDKPFFLYLATNAPHGPYIVPDKYSKPFEAMGMPEKLAKFYGMISNLDENLGWFREQLESLDIADDTLLIYMTDNGTTAGWICDNDSYPYYNAGMRGWKSFAWEGGHRVPFFLHWPNGGLKHGRDIDGLTAHIDVLPTLVDLLGLRKPDGPRLDGVSLAGSFRGDSAAAIPDRSLFVHVQRAFVPPKWTNSVAMKNRWRLIDGKQLYDLKSDPGQQTDVAEKHPDVVASLRADYEAWWSTIEPATMQTVHSGLGGAHNPTTLYSHDWLVQGGDSGSAWHQNHIKRGDLLNGPWAVDVEKSGAYRITLHRWAPYLGKAMGMKSARLAISGFDRTIELEPEAAEATFTVDLTAGPTMLQSWLERPDGGVSGAYYVVVERLGD